MTQHARSTTGSSNRYRRMSISEDIRTFLRVYAGLSGGEASAALLAVALAKSQGERGVELLEAAGCAAARKVLASLPAICEPDTAAKAFVRPDSSLRDLLGTDLRDFVTGDMDSDRALSIILGQQDVVPRIMHVLATLAHEYPTAEPGRCMADKRLFLQAVSRYYHERLMVAGANHSQGDKGISDFMAGEKDQRFSEAMDILYRKESQTRRELFAGRPYRCSVLGKIWAEHGEVAAHTVGCALLAEYGIIGNGAVSVLQVAQILDPKRFHRNLGLARATVTSLRDAGLVTTVPPITPVRPRCHVLPAEDVLAEFERYLADEAITEGEIEDVCRRLA